MRRFNPVRGWPSAALFPPGFTGGYLNQAPAEPISTLQHADRSSPAFNQIRTRRIVAMATAARIAPFAHTAGHSRARNAFAW